MTDYAIARCIVDLHSHVDRSVERVYSVDDIHRYIMFAKQFRPKVRFVVLRVGKTVSGTESGPMIG